jgi:hypothetical protein
MRLITTGSDGRRHEQLLAGAEQYSRTLLDCFGIRLPISLEGRTAPNFDLGEPL